MFMLYYLIIGLVICILDDIEYAIKDFSGFKSYAKDLKKRLDSYLCVILTWPLFLVGKILYLCTSNEQKES